MESRTRWFAQSEAGRDPKGRCLQPRRVATSEGLPLRYLQHLSVPTGDPALLPELPSGPARDVTTRRKRHPVSRDMEKLRRRKS